MKITFDSATLSQQLSVASRVINNKNFIPILGCFMMEVSEDGGSLNITASDNENTLCIAAPLVSFTPDEDPSRRRFCIPSRIIIDALKEIPSQPVTLTINMQTWEINGKYSSGTFSIVGENADEYPNPPALAEDTTELSISSSILQENIDGTIFALADDEIRPVMTGIYFDMTPATLTCVGTDGRRLVRRITTPPPVPSAAPSPSAQSPSSLPSPVPCRAYLRESSSTSPLTLPPSPAGFILPRKTAVILRSLLPKAEGTIYMCSDTRQILIEHPTFTMFARLIDGHYPNYDAVIPKDNPLVAHLNTSDILPAIRRILTFADNESALVRMTFNSSGLKLSGKDVRLATSAEESVACDWSSADSISIGAKGGILMEVFQHLPKEVVISLSTPKSAMLFRPATEAPSQSLLMLVMPMML